MKSETKSYVKTWNIIGTIAYFIFIIGIWFVYPVKNNIDLIFNLILIAIATGALIFRWYSFVAQSKADQTKTQTNTAVRATNVYRGAHWIVGNTIGIIAMTIVGLFGLTLFIALILSGDTQGSFIGLLIAAVGFGIAGIFWWSMRTDKHAEHLVKAQLKGRTY